MLKRNRFGFRMRRRSLSGRLFQFLVVLTVVSLFIYLILYSTNFSKDFYGPDFQWLHTRNVSTYVIIHTYFKYLHRAALEYLPSFKNPLPVSCEIGSIPN